MTRMFAALLFLIVATPALAQPLDGTWLMFKDPADAELARLEAAGGRLPADEIAERTRIEFAGSTATVRAGDVAIGMTLAPTETEWGVDAQVSGLTGTTAPITFLRVERASPGRATLTTYSGQTPLESFAILRVTAED